MDQTSETSREVDTGSKASKQKTSRVQRKKMQKTRSFTEALREKYCMQDESVGEFIIDIVVRGIPRNNGPTAAELAHLRNVVLSNRRVSTGGLPDNGLATLCPNVTDLDLSSNLFESWADLLPLLSQLPHLKFLNLSRNHITRHKEELLCWSTPLPKVENMVLNSTGIPLREVLALARLMPALRELHICCNYYRDLGSVEIAIKDGALAKLECLRLNENVITSWAEVWKLRSLPCLTHLILSENPLCDVYYDPSDQGLDMSACEMDSPNITCHSDGEDSAFGSPQFKYPVKKPVSSPKCKKKMSFVANKNSTATSQQVAGSTDESNRNTEDRNRNRRDGNENEGDGNGNGGGGNDNGSDGNGNAEGSDLTHQKIVGDLLDHLISHACERLSIQESCEQCEAASAEEVNGRTPRAARIDSDNLETEHKAYEGIWGDYNENFSADAGDAHMNQNENHALFYLEQDTVEEGEGCGCEGNDTERRGTPCTEDVEDQQNRNAAGTGTDRREEETSVPFAKLHTLCLSRTSICEFDHLHSLNEFPQLQALRIMDIALFSNIHQEDRRKLYVASLPKVRVLNGSEVTVPEREKAERFYLRHFLEMEDKMHRYAELEKKHGPVIPLFDIDLGARFQKEATLTFLLNGVKKFTETISVIQPVGKLRTFVAKQLAIPRTCFRMYHNACGPYQDPADQSLDELFLDSLPLSRFDFMDGDELHVEFMTEESSSPHFDSSFKTSHRL